MLLHDRLPRFSRSARLAASVALLATTFASSAAFASPSAASVGISSDPSNGNMLTDERGMTLYQYTADQPNTSTCYDGCAKAWPPVIVDGVPQALDPSLGAGLGTAPRTDGTQQLTYNGAPLYYYVGDTQPHTATGQGSDGVWFVATP